MKRFVPLLALLIATSITGVLAEKIPATNNNLNDPNAKKSNVAAFEMGFGFSSDGADFLNANFIYGLPINPHLSCGLGIGLQKYFEYYHPGEIQFPVFGNFRANLKNGNTIPYFSFNLGYRLNREFDPQAIVLNPTAGISFRNSGKARLDIGLGYDFQPYGYQHEYNFVDITGAFCLKMGFSF